MTEKQMNQFLKAEGWNPAFGCVKDPSRGHWYSNKGVDLKIAYHIALKRKSARDTRRLKKAGWTCVPHREHRWINPISGISRTKAEALATFGEAP